MVTPFDARLRVDEVAAVSMMHHLVDHGSDGLVICGTTGEAATLSDEEHLGLIELAVQEARSLGYAAATFRPRAQATGVFSEPAA